MLKWHNNSPTFTSKLEKNNVMYGPILAFIINVCSLSQGMEGFKHVKKSTNVAAQATGLSLGLVSRDPICQEGHSILCCYFDRY